MDRTSNDKIGGHSFLDDAFARNAELARVEYTSNKIYVQRHTD